MLKPDDLTTIQVNIPTEGKFLYAYILITTAVQPQLNLDFSFRHVYDSIAMTQPRVTKFEITTATISFKRKLKDETLILEVQKDELPQVRLYICDNKLDDRGVIMYLRLILLAKLYHVLVTLGELTPITDLTPLVMNNTYSKHWGFTYTKEGRDLWKQLHPADDITVYFPRGD